MRQLISVMLSGYLVTTAAVAQNIVANATPTNDVINEHLDTHAQTAGGVLVGVRLGAYNPKTFDPKDVRFEAPPDQEQVIKKKQVICVRGVSQNGLYWTRTPYNLDADAPPDAQEIRLTPFTKIDDTFSSTVALLAFLAPDERCDEEEAMILPERSGTGSARSIHLLINSGKRKLSVQLTTADHSIQASCTPVDAGGRVAFNHACQIELPEDIPLNGPELKVTLDNRLKKKTFTHPLKLPLHQYD